MDLSVIFSNIIGFDGLIFIMAAVNAGIFILARRSVNRLYGCMHKQVYTPCADDDIRDIDRDISGLSVKSVSEMREQAESLYTLFVNITGIFPLLGILGTVISLLGMVGSPDSVTNGFFAALTSTFWGLVAAIAFKFSDSFIAARLDDSVRAAELYISKAITGKYPSADKPDVSADDSEGSFDNSVLGRKFAGDAAGKNMSAQKDSTDNGKPSEDGK